MPIFSSLTSKVFAGLLAVASFALLIVGFQLSSARDRIRVLEDWQQRVVLAVRVATGNETVTAKSAEGQIEQLGVIRIQLKRAVRVQNDAIDALEREGRLARETAAKAAAERAAAVKRANALAAQLRKQAKVPVAAPDMEAAVRATQDQLFEAGL